MIRSSNTFREILRAAKILRKATPIRRSTQPSYAYSSGSIQKLRLLSMLCSLLKPRGLYLLRFLRYHRRLPLFRNPSRISDKLALRILDGEASLRRKQMADKLACFELVRGTSPGLRTKQVYAIYDAPEQFSLAPLPERFALKPNNASGLQRLILDKSKESERELQTVMARWLKLSYYSASQEPSYRGIQPKVFAEELTLSATDFLPDEFRLYCFYGKVGFIEYEFGQTMEESVFADRNWNRLDVRYKWQPPVDSIPAPAALKRAIEAAEKLAAGFDFIRVDLYDLEGELVFNEISNSPWGGLVRFTPNDADELLGAYWEGYAAHENTQADCAFINATGKSISFPDGEAITIMQSARIPEGSRR